MKSLAVSGQNIDHLTIGHYLAEKGFCPKENFNIHLNLAGKKKANEIWQDAIELLSSSLHDLM